MIRVNKSLSEQKNSSNVQNIFTWVVWNFRPTPVLNEKQFLCWANYPMMDTIFLWNRVWIIISLVRNNFCCLFSFNNWNRLHHSATYHINPSYKPWFLFLPDLIFQIFFQVLFLCIVFFVLFLCGVLSIFCFFPRLLLAQSIQMKLKKIKMTHFFLVRF